MDEFLLKFFPTVYEKKHMAINTDYCKYDNQLLQLFTSALYLAGLCAAFPASYITRLYGRKWTMFMGGISFFVGAVLNGVGLNLAMLVIGRILLGVGVGFASQVPDCTKQSLSCTKACQIYSYIIYLFYCEVHVWN